MLDTSCTCTKLRRAARALTRLYDKALEPLGLTAAQFSLLRVSQRLGSVHISAFAEATGLERSTLGRNLRPLVVRDWVSVSSGEDQRTQMVTLTGAGRRLIAKALPAWQKVQADVERRLGTVRWSQLFAIASDVENWD